MPDTMGYHTAGKKQSGGALSLLDAAWLPDLRIGWVEHGITFEKSVWLENDRELPGRHQWEIFRPREMGMTHRIPDHDVRVINR
jgi:hypothetical protein